MNVCKNVFRIAAKTLLLAMPLPAAFHEAGAQPVTVYSAGEGGYAAFRIPALVTAADGSLLAFAEGRKDSAVDNGDVDIVLKRSGDGGRSWTALSVVWSDGDNTCGNPAPVVDASSGRVLLLATWNKGADNEDRIRDRTAEDTRRVYVLRSGDNGKSWSVPQEITPQVKQDDWTWYATGPGHAIQLRYGAHKGRIVVPCDHTRYVDGMVLGHSHLIYSDNGGRDWQIGAVAQSGNECTTAELKDGTLMLNMREFKFHRNSSIKHLRQVAFSVDGGETLGGAFSDEGLPEPVCQASLASYPAKGRKRDGLLFSNPASKTGRTDFTVKYSEDGGRTWTAVYRSPFATGAYSDLAVMGDGSAAVLYETGDKSPYERIVMDFIPASDIRK